MVAFFCLYEFRIIIYRINIIKLMKNIELFEGFLSNIFGAKKIVRLTSDQLDDLESDINYSSTDLRDIGYEVNINRHETWYPRNKDNTRDTRVSFGIHVYKHGEEIDLDILIEFLNSIKDLIDDKFDLDIYEGVDDQGVNITKYVFNKNKLIKILPKLRHSWMCMSSDTHVDSEYLNRYITSIYIDLVEKK